MSEFVPSKIAELFKAGVGTEAALSNLLLWLDEQPEIVSLARGLRTRPKARQEGHPLYQAYRAMGRDLPE